MEIEHEYNKSQRKWMTNISRLVESCDALNDNRNTIHAVTVWLLIQNSPIKMNVY